MAYFPANNVGGLKYKTLATASGSATWASKLSTLYSTFSGLTTDKQRCCIIEYAGQTYLPSKLSGKYTRFSGDTSHLYMEIVDISTSKYLISTDGAAPQDKSSTSISGAVTLLMLTIE